MKKTLIIFLFIILLTISTGCSYHPPERLIEVVKPEGCRWVLMQKVDSFDSFEIVGESPATSTIELTFTGTTTPSKAEWRCEQEGVYMTESEYQTYLLEQIKDSLE